LFRQYFAFSKQQQAVVKITDSLYDKTMPRSRYVLSFSYILAFFHSHGLILQDDFSSFVDYRAGIGRNRFDPGGVWPCGGAVGG
jgi:hypothetical protein